MGRMTYDIKYIKTKKESKSCFMITYIDRAWFYDQLPMDQLMLRVHQAVHHKCHDDVSPQNPYCAYNERSII